MKKTFVIEVDCANCANKMEQAVGKLEGVVSATVNFMGQKLIVEFAEGAQWEPIMEQARKQCKKIDRDMEIYL